MKIILPSPCFAVTPDSVLQTKVTSLEKEKEKRREERENNLKTSQLCSFPRGTSTMSYECFGRSTRHTSPDTNKEILSEFFLLFRPKYSTPEILVTEAIISVSISE
jgi:hypothetical protein